MSCVVILDMYLSLWLADYTDPMSDMDVLQSNNY